MHYIGRWVYDPWNAIFDSAYRTTALTQSGIFRGIWKIHATIFLTPNFLIRACSPRTLSLIESPRSSISTRLPMILQVALLGLLLGLLGQVVARPSIVTNRHAKQQRSPESMRASSRTLKPSDRIRFLVNGSAIPEVNFDIGVSYAGLMPLTRNTSDRRSLCTGQFLRSCLQH